MLFLSYHFSKFDKNANFGKWYDLIMVLFIICLATIGVCVFCAANFGCRTFLF